MTDCGSAHVEADLTPLTRQLADPAFFLTQDFHSLLRALRHRSPVHWCQPWPQRGFWAVTRQSDMKTIADQPMLYSNEIAGNIIPADPEAFRHHREEQGYGTVLSNVDPPLHTALRGVYGRFFSGPRIAKHEGLCQSLTDQILDELDGRDGFDFVMDVAAHLPARLICRLLGVPAKDWPYITRYANSFASFSDPALQLGDTPADTFRIAKDKTFAYVEELVNRRRAVPEDDLASVAATAEVAGAPLGHREAAWIAWSLLAAGFETSRNIMSGGLLALIEHSDQDKMLRADPGLLQGAVDEMVRWTTPATGLLRVATADTEFGGHAIKADDWLVMFLDSANRDEAVFSDPYRFDIRRRPNLYLSFGHGIHNCIGRMLALLEARVMIRTMLARFDAVTIAGPLEWSASSIAKGLKRMPVRVQRRAGNGGLAASL
jgi:cholest-4-en-3-one 26-monooxygenase